MLENEKSLGAGAVSLEGTLGPCLSFPLLCQFQIRWFCSSVLSHRDMLSSRDHMSGGGGVLPILGFEPSRPITASCMILFLYAKLVALL